jgi:hypothetical protein
MSDLRDVLPGEDVLLTTYGQKERLARVERVSPRYIYTTRGRFGRRDGRTSDANHYAGSRIRRATAADVLRITERIHRWSANKAAAEYLERLRAMIPTMPTDDMQEVVRRLMGLVRDMELRAKNREGA